MGAYSTLRITRSKALKIVIDKLLGGISNGELEDYLDKVLANNLYNCVIVPDHCEDNDDNEICL